ncbi:hypothetical protein [Hymenobacter psoromatis]|uniref:hypothetical protein n=1 Tax=Hymenobacter psoromatis TaxID=1484116 RepID=UPI001CBC4809|nr:hypothetical protein [Hymenobacter psoromatis]
MSAIFLRRFSRLLLLALRLAALPPALAQAQAVPDSLPGLSRPFARYTRQALVEQLFAHLDRPTYAAGETMWLKIYAVDGTRHQPLALSKIAYVELLNAQQQPVLQARLALSRATGHGSLALPPDLPAGPYVLRAYTSWMRNFSPEGYFHCPVTVLNTARPPGPAARPAAAGYDVQFFPEGGQLVRGLRSRVGLRVVNAAGQGVAATGIVRDAQGQPVATFETLKFGLGSFDFTPALAGAGYVAAVQITDGQDISVPLPAATEAGYVLRLADATADSVRLTVQAQGSALPPGPVAVLGHAGQRIVAAVRGPLVGGVGEFAFAKKDLPDGTMRFTLFDGAARPRAERLYFQRPRHPLALVVAAPAGYAPRARVEVQLRADAPANASLAVYQLDSLNAAEPADIDTFLSLTSELKGHVEAPNYYLRDTSATARAALDNLLLTQGWSRFRWDDVLAARPPALPYLPEVNGHFVRGRLTDRRTGAPAAGLTAYLASPSRAIRLYNAISQVDGILRFETNPFYGPTQLVLQTDYLRDSTYHLELLSPFSTQFAAGQARPFALSQGLAAALTQRSVQVQTQRRFFSRFENAYTQPAHDTLAFYGRPDEQYLLDDYTRFPVLEEVMREYVPGVLVRKRRDGFHFLVVDKRNDATFRNNPLVLLDGVPVFDVNKIMAFSPLKIRKLDVVDGHFFHGPLTYDGVVSYTTYKGDLAGFPLPPQALLEEYEGLQGEREFFAPRYETAARQQSRLPDFRNLLHWQPDMTLTPGQPRTLTFYTSDQVGRYLVVAQGLAADGRAGSARLVLEVKPAL